MLFHNYGLPQASEAHKSQFSNSAETWKVCRHNFKIFLKATESDCKNDLVKSSILLHYIGQPAKSIYHTFEFPEGEEMNYDFILKMFNEYFKPRKNLTFLRFSFLTARQDEDDKFAEFYTRLRGL